MGGFGSGSYYRGSSRLTIEETKRIDIRYLKKRGMLLANTRGTLSWTCGSEPAGDISYTMFDREMRLNFRYRCNGGEWEKLEQIIWFTETPCNYGGSRKWFRCPQCDTRVAVLYGANVKFLCRHCYRLPYASQGESALDRMSRKADKIGKKLEADEYVVDADQWKPKGMHWRTFYNLKMAEIQMDERMNNAFMARFGRLM